MILHLDSSIRRAVSASRSLGAILIERLLQNGDTNAVRRDPVAAPIDHLTLTDLAEAATARGEFFEDDTAVIAAALFAFTIPSRHKVWSERILSAGRTVANGADRLEDLVPDKRVVIALVRGGSHGEGCTFAQLEHAETLLGGTFAFVGVRNDESIIAEGLALGEGRRRVHVERTVDVAKQLSAVRAAA